MGNFILVYCLIVFSLMGICQSKPKDEFYDFKKSYLTWLTKEESYGRWQVESVIEIYDKNKLNLIDRIVSVGPVMACTVYGKSPLFKTPAYTYQALFGNDRVKIVRNFFPYKDLDSSHLIENRFKKINYKLTKVNYNKNNEIHSENLRKTVLENKDIIAQIDWETKHQKYRLWCIVKHINVNDKDEFQVETGPVPIPKGLGKKGKVAIDNFTFCYLAFNNFNEFDALSYGSKNQSNLLNFGLTKKNRTIRHYNLPLKSKAKIKLLTIE